jgi:hypothetical protein
VVIDRYTKVVLTVIAVALVVIAARPWLPDVFRPDAAQAQGAVPKYELSIPRAWGKILSFSNNNLLMESSDQTLRIVDVEGKPPEYPKIKALIRWQ